ncbi:MAG: LysR family transcriptional regulator [Hyphomicrobiales bacterium]|nr:MAG: LysR family transcriptional regulator [Hyphomicrobiales bacterium]
MRWNLDDVPVFVAVVEQKGVSAAADQLGLAKSTVSKSLSRLEHALGVRLVERNPRNLRITSEGEAFYRRSLLIMEQASELNAVMEGMTSTPSGRLVVALPIAFSREIVARHLGGFRDRYPGIDLEIVITSHSVDIIGEQIDIAVAVGPLDDSELIVKPLYQGELLWVASPDYARTAGLDAATDDLLPHIQICEKRYAKSRFPIRVNDDKRVIDLETGIVRVNDPVTVREAVLAGCGVSLVPDQYSKRQLADGTLVRVCEHIAAETSASALSAIYPSRRLISSRTRAFLDFLVEICRKI